MGQVLQLPELRGARKAPPAHGMKPARGSTYYCTRCGAERFVLAASGMIHCGPCGAWMRNITVAPASSEKPRPKA
jgi:ribosomal protein L37AE/L43A